MAILAPACVADVALRLGGSHYFHISSALFSPQAAFWLPPWPSGSYGCSELGCGVAKVECAASAGSQLAVRQTGPPHFWMFLQIMTLWILDLAAFQVLEALRWPETEATALSLAPLRSTQTADNATPLPREAFQAVEMLE